MSTMTTRQQQQAVYQSPLPSYYYSAGDNMVCAPVGIIANPGPLGLCGFALTTFVLSCYNAGLFGVSDTAPVNVVTGLALFYGGVAQGLAGMWEFRTGNTFGATAFTSYAAFWLSYAVILIPAFQVLDPYLKSAPSSISPAVATFLLAWTIFTLLMLLATFRTSVALIALFATLSLTFILLTISEFGSSLMLHRVAGYTGIATAIIAWYNALAGILTEDNSLFTLPVGKIDRR